MHIHTVLGGYCSICIQCNTLRRVSRGTDGGVKHTHIQRNYKIVVRVIKQHIVTELRDITCRVPRGSKKGYTMP